MDFYTEPATNALSWQLSQLIASTGVIQLNVESEIRFGSRYCENGIQSSSDGCPASHSLSPCYPFSPHIHAPTNGGD